MEGRLVGREYAKVDKARRDDQAARVDPNIPNIARYVRMVSPHR